jgi:hypothetical protein
VFGLDPIGQRLGLLLDELLECREPLADLFLQIGGVLREAILEPAEPPVGVAHLAAEQDVANLLDVAAGVLVAIDGDGLRDGLGANGLVLHGVHPLCRHRPEPARGSRGSARANPLG